MIESLFILIGDIQYVNWFTITFQARANLL